MFNHHQNRIFFHFHHIIISHPLLDFNLISDLSHAQHTRKNPRTIRFAEISRSIVIFFHCYSNRLSLACSSFFIASLLARIAKNFQRSIEYILSLLLLLFGVIFLSLTHSLASRFVLDFSKVILTSRELLSEFLTHSTQHRHRLTKREWNMKFF